MTPVSHRFARPSSRLTKVATMALVGLMTLAGCSEKAKVETQPSPVEVSVQSPSFFDACTTKGNKGDAKASLGRFTVTTNVWNPDAASRFSECVKVSYSHSTGLVDGLFNWDAVSTTNQVLAYPNLAYGWRVGENQGSSTRRLPATVASLGDMVASGVIESVCAPGASCTHNTAFELLFSATPTPTTWPPTAELMVWLQATCGSCNAGKLQGKVVIDGVSFDLYQGMVTPPTGTASWTYVAYVAESTVTRFNFNLKNFVTDSVKRGYLKTTDHLAVIELGTEITSGQGSTTISGYGIR